MPEPTKRRGRQPDANSKSGKIRELLKTGMAASDIAKKLGCTPALVYNVKARAGGGGNRRGPGRPRKATSGASPSLNGIAGILDMVKNAESERARLRTALEKIQTVLASALA
jgi:transposase-like protein